MQCQRKLKGGRKKVQSFGRYSIFPVVLTGFYTFYEPEVKQKIQPLQKYCSNTVIL